LGKPLLLTHFQPMKKYCLIFILSLLSCFVNAQNFNYNFYNYSTENGLPTNDYQYLYQDSYGFLWLASFDGLFRWDGYTFKKYYHDEKDSRSLDNNIVYSIYEDSQKRLWIGTIEGLNLYDYATDKFTRCTIRKKGERIPINSILEDQHHQLWLGTSNGLCRYNYETNHAEWFFNHVDDDVIFCMTVDAFGNIWTGTFNSGIRKFNPFSKTFLSYKHINGDIHSLCSNRIKSILADKENKIWVGTEDRGISVLSNNGVIVNQYDNFSKENSISHNNIICLYEDKNQTIWIGVSRDVAYYIDKGHSVPTALTNNAQNNNHDKLISISSIREDKFSNIWFASNTYGLFYTNNNKNTFKNYSQNLNTIKGLKSTVITCFYEDKKGLIWLGTNGSGLLKFDPLHHSFSMCNIPSLNGQAINDIKGDKRGKIWIATWGEGIKQLDPVTNQVTNYLNDPANNNSLISNNVKALLPDDSLIWIGSHGEGLAAYDTKHNRFINYKNNSSIPFQMHDPAWINHLFKDSQKRLWISTYSGVFVFDGKKLSHFVHTTESSSISSNSVNMVTEDNTGKIWIISELGLDQFDNTSKRFIRFTAKYNLPETMKAIVVDRNNRLWISSNEGIISFDQQKMQIKRYDANDGLQGNTFFQKSVLKGENGMLYFGSPKGMNVFNPDSLKPVHLPSFFYFTNLYIYNKLQRPGETGSPLKQVLSFTDTLTLTQKQSYFSIEFTAINLYAPAKTEYSYKLEGMHDQWIDIQAERKVSFTNLEPGNYTLKIRYTDADGEWQKVTNNLYIVILPQWWQTWWFKILALLFCASAVVGVFYLRVASIRKRNKFLKAEVAKRTHQLNETNSNLIEQNDEIKLQKEKLEESNSETMRQSDKILEQQQHIISQNQKLEHTVTDLEKSNNTKDHFFSILAHDLKNPISALTDITGFMKDNLMKMEKKTLQEHMDSMHTSSAAVYELLINLLNWSRTQSKKIEYSPSDWKINELVNKNARLLESQFNNKHIQLKVYIDNTHQVFADYNTIDTVIRNIISNSIKFTEYNGQVSIHSIEEENNIILRVSDNGIGMLPEQLEKLFSIDKTNTTGTAGEKGTGLGLVISKEFLEINKGEIWVESEPGKGSAFYIKLPKSNALKNTTVSKDLKKDTIQDNLTLDFWEAFPIDKLQKIKGKKILIVDDNKELRDYLKLILSDTFEIFEAENGNDGLKIASEIHLAVIITDLLMPGMNGLQFCKEIKSRTDTSHIPVIILTSQWDENVKVSGYEAGADVYLTKPIKKELLIQVILSLIQNQEKLHQKILEKILDNNPLPSEKITINKLDEEFLNRLVLFIETKIIDPNLDARLLSKEMAVSRTVLYSKIKTLTGQSVHEFIKSIRLKKSLTLLLDGRLSINQVALEVGFNSHSYFDKCFVRQYGTGPKEYINKKKAANII
jgi:ligand-binding sensor domain-containing protein/signal transduction histidine kinase/DNA-binding response OmpR family regulator